MVKMNRFKPDTVHAPLTNITCPDPVRLKHVKARALSAFATIQKFMGQLPYEDLSADIFEMLREGIDLPEIRNEIYVATMKQMTNNPQIEAVGRAWQLLALCLLCFPPSYELEVS